MESLEEIAKVCGDWFEKIMNDKPTRRVLAVLGDELLKVVELDIEILRIDSEIGLTSLDRPSLARKTHRHIHSNEYLGDIASRIGLYKHGLDTIKLREDAGDYIEAVVTAIFYNKGYSEAKKFVYENIINNENKFKMLLPQEINKSLKIYPT